MTMKNRDIKGVVSRERRYSTLAKKEGKYALAQEKKEKARGDPEMAKDSAHEAKIAFQFAHKRREIADREAKKLVGHMAGRRETVGAIRWKFKKKKS